MMDIDFERSHESLPWIELLDRTFQMLEMPEHDGEWSESRLHAHPPQSEGGLRYRSLCSGSFLDSRHVITALHCLRSKKGAIEANHLIRHHQYEVAQAPSSC